MRLVVRCVECGACWDAEHDHGDGDGDRDWQVFFTAAQPPQPIAYCPGCFYTRSTTKQGRRSRGNGERRTDVIR
jgi:hypothetical protein